MLFTARAVVGQDAGRGVVDVAAFPGLVRHPEVDDHLRLTRIVFFKNFAVEQRFLGERLRVGEARAAGLKLLIRVAVLSECFQMVNHRMADGVGKRGLLAVEDVMREIIALERMTEQVFTLAVDVHFLRRVDGEDIADEVEIPERDARLERVDGDAAVGAEHVIHVQLTDTLFRFLLEFFCGRGKIGIFIAKQLIRNLAGEQDADVGVLVDPFAEQVHAHAGANRGDVKRAEHFDDKIERIQHLLARHDDLGVVAADVVGDFAGILEVDGVLAHADGKGADRRFALARGDRADERRIEAAREQEADLCVGYQALVDARDELFVDVFTHSLEVVIADLIDFCDVVVADELAVLVIMSGRERQDHVAESCEVFRLAGEDDDALLVEAVVERPDADGVARSDEFARLTVVEDERKFRVEQTEHVDAVLPPERQ